MQKLIESYRAAPTDANKAKLEKYLQKHIMAACMLTPDETAFLRLNNVKGV